MNPEEKARYLIDKMYSKASPDNGMGYYEAKDCAIVAVDEIIRAKPCLDFWDFSREIAIGLNIEYWQQVKQEIEKL